MSTSLKFPPIDVTFSLRLPKTRYLPHLLVGLAVASALGVAYTTVILPNANQTVPKVTWGANPLTISFAATSLSGSATDSFTCIPSALAIVLRTNGGGGNVAITVNPTSLPNCGSAAQQVVVTATCLVPASSCAGNFGGTLQVRQPTTYRDLSSPLNIVITVS